jgi:3-deoxy-7-phosphoheptulonate synthase
LERALGTLRSLPPLVTSFEVESLKSQIAAAQLGRRFVLQGGDCAETLADCRPEVIAAKLKILLQMSLVIVHGAKRPVTRVGRFAGQYAKPRSKPMETRQVNGADVSHPSYFGDLVNRAPFDARSRAFDPELLVDGYKHAAMTLNFIRSLTKSGFADLHHPEYWDLSFVQSAHLPPELRDQYVRTSGEVAAALEFMESLGEQTVDDLSRVEFFTSHEGLNLLYESAQTRRVPRRSGWYCLTTHLPWIGERTRAVDGAHVAFFGGIENPVGVKVGPTCTPDELRRLLDALNPRNEAGRIVLITRMGAKRIEEALPGLLEAVRAEGQRVLWVCDPMHGNTESTSSGHKTRRFDHIVAEVESCMDVHRAVGTVFGGVHFELTGDDVTECTGGADNLTEADLATNYSSACDPRLNYRQALEIAFRVSEKFRRFSSP